MKKLIFVAIIACCILLSGCTFMQMDRGSIQTVANLDKDQYEITGDIEGNASVTTVFFFFAIGLESNYGTLYNPTFHTPWDNGHGGVEGMAIYNAIENSDGADMIIAPRFETRVTGFPPFYWKTTVKVKGKGIKIKN
ncbi:hypothetical protein K9N50_01680 [bacterium]|nr:hypothetical protein [bacterium]